MNPRNSARPFAKKSFGQNFLSDSTYVDKIIAELDPRPDQTIVEIGAGRGALTARLLEKLGKVIAIELDRDLIPVLEREFGGRENFRLVGEDALRVDFAGLVGPNAGKIKLVANLPYNVSTAILQKLIAQRQVFSEMILMFQREVVERIVAAPGSKERGFLTVLVQTFLEAETLFDVPPQAFVPAPKVWSAVVRLSPIAARERTDSYWNGGTENLYRQLISAGFVQKRKTILNNLKSSPPDLKAIFGDVPATLAAAGIDPQRRAETLTVDEWVGLFEVVGREFENK